MHRRARNYRIAIISYFPALCSLAEQGRVFGIFNIARHCTLLSRRQLVKDARFHVGAALLSLWFLSRVLVLLFRRLIGIDRLRKSRQVLRYRRQISHSSSRTAGG